MAYCTGIYRKANKITAQRFSSIIVDAGQADGKFVMCVLAAPHKVDMKALKKQLGAKSVELAQENEIGNLFPDCELGAEPPFGNLYDLQTVMDKSLEADDHITFSG